MLLFKRQNLIKFGLNITFVHIKKYQFLNKIIISNNFLYSIYDIKLLTYKLILFQKFINIYKKKNTKKLHYLFVDGSLHVSQQSLLRIITLKNNHYYINDRT